MKRPPIWLTLLVYFGFLFLAGERTYLFVSEKLDSGASMVANSQQQQHFSASRFVVENRSTVPAVTCPENAPSMDTAALQAMIAKTIKTEIRKQQLAVSSQAATSQQVVEPLTKEEEQSQQQAYTGAEDLIDTAITFKSADAYFASNFLSYLDQVSPEQEIELRKRYASAVNSGLIKPEAPLELMAVQN